MPSQWEDRSKPQHRVYRSVHHGKSTTVGRLLLDSGHIEERVIEKNEKLAAESGSRFVLRVMTDQGRARAWYHHRRRSQGVLHSLFLLDHHRCAGPPRLRQEHHRCFQADTAVLLCAANGKIIATDQGARFLGQGVGCQGPHRPRQQNGHLRCWLGRREVQGRLC